jgi:hypothetical protein
MIGQMLYIVRGTLPPETKCGANDADGKEAYHTFPWKIAVNHNNLFHRL